MFDKLKDLWQLRGQMEEIKKRLDAMVIKVQSRNGIFDITVTGSQEVKEIKILKSLSAYTNAQIEEDLAQGLNKAMKDAQGMAAQVMGGMAGITPPEA